MWIERHVNRIRAHGPVTLIDGGDSGNGTAFIMAELIAGEAPVLWLDFSSRQAAGPLTAEEQLAAESWGLPHSGPVTSLDQALEILSGFAAETTVPMIALTGAEKVPELAEKLLRSSGPRLALIICGHGALVGELHSRHPDSLYISRQDLRITVSEAREAAFGSLPDSAVAMLVKQSGGAYETVLKEISRARHEPEPVRPSPLTINGGVAALSPAPASLFDTLLRFRLWQPALLECLRCCPARLDEVIDRAGEECLERGQVQQFWRILTGLPAELQNDERILYWLLMTSTTRHQAPGILARVLNHLSVNEAPRLRALAAAFDLLSSPLQEAERAHEADGNEISELFLAQIGGIHGNPAARINQLHRLYRYFNSSGEVFRRLQAALTLASTYIMTGRYANARHWAGYVLRKCGQHDKPLRSLHLCAAGLYAYASLLSGDVRAGQRELDAHEFPSELVGARFIDVYLKAVADYRLLEGETHDALQLYQRIRHAYSAFSGILALSDVVNALLLSGRNREALQLAMDFHTRSSDQTPYERHSSGCALGVALLMNGDSAGAALLARAMTYAADPETLHAPLLARAGIHLARMQLSEGDPAAAIETLELARPALVELSPPGWNLYGGPDPLHGDVRELWAGISEPLILNFLGHEPVLDRKSGSRRISLRRREILLVLACHPEGLSGDRLAGLLDITQEKLVGMRTNLARMKQHYPLKSRPYRLAVEVRADFRILPDLIQQGRLEEALNLYTGPLLPESEVVFIRVLRNELEESLRQAVLHAGDGELLLRLARKLGTDLELWEKAVETLPQDHPSYSLAAASLVTVRASWSE
jgi:tetratricopeptide (TPR) repeat protein